MRYLLLILLLAACNCAGADIHPAGAAQFIRELSNASAQIVRKREDGTYRNLCTAVWLSPTTMLTAAHCVEPEPASVMDCIVLTDDAAFEKCMDGLLAGAPSILGATVPFRTWSDALLSGTDKVRSARVARVSRHDHEHDLALLEVVGDAPSHGIARMAVEDPLPGDVVHVMGHTHSNPWSYSPGMVGAIRDTENQNGDLVHVVQIVSAASGGNSGGGAFNARGELIGICVFGSSDAFGFFVHRDVLAGFVR